MPLFIICLLFFYSTFPFKCNSCLFVLFFLLLYPKCVGWSRWKNADIRIILCSIICENCFQSKEMVTLHYTILYYDLPEKGSHHYLWYQFLYPAKYPAKISSRILDFISGQIPGSKEQMFITSASDRKKEKTKGR